MKKILFVFLFFPMTIYAQQEPQWLMPFYFETADGQKDTVYIGYDLSASGFSDVIDEQFLCYEQSVTFEQSIFNVFVDVTAFSGMTTIRKGSIRSILQGVFHIGFVGTGTYPITMKWDFTQLYSENLPEMYPYIPDRPRARIDIYPEIGPCNPSCIGDCYYTLTDSLYPEINDYMAWDCMGIITDSVVFECPPQWQVSVGQGMMIRIRQYDTIAHWWEDTKIDNEFIKDIRTYPNPANSYVKIENLPAEDLIIVLCDITGRNSMAYHSFDRKEIALDIRSLQNGIYFLKILDKSDKYIYSNKIIKI